MTHLDQIPQLWYEWKRLTPYFLGDENDYFEIVFTQIEPGRMLTTLTQLLDTCSHISTVFFNLQTRQPARVASFKEAITRINTADLAGAVGISLPTLPLITLYFDLPNQMSLTYTSGNHWSPIALATFLLLLHDMSHSLASPSIHIASPTFTQDDMQAFSQVLADYV